VSVQCRPFQNGALKKKFFFKKYLYPNLQFLEGEKCKSIIRLFGFESVDHSFLEVFELISGTVSLFFRFFKKIFFYLVKKIFFVNP